MSSETPKRGRRPLPPPSESQRKRLERLYIKERLTVEEVAARLGTTRGQAQGMLRRAGIPRRKRGPQPAPLPTAAERRELERLYVKQGLTVTEIGRRLGMSRDATERLLTRTGVPLRRYGRPRLPSPEELRRLYMGLELGNSNERHVVSG